MRQKTAFGEPIVATAPSMMQKLQILQHKVDALEEKKKKKEEEEEEMEGPPNMTKKGWGKGGNQHLMQPLAAPKKGAGG